ncbi:hypothetical protein EXM90_11755 [Clostridium botulinum]|nr:hypothetical protein RSJ19_01230 [Clostridium botulinum]MBN3359350.1 hypothetical protein [Clostridium botulinum]MBN3367179.1 hypothetical protein [Clostridium botulinum]MBN3371812.1 hypothetical protein [Clostridium botulinum]MBN3375696.1 hypothetical protein [Clostridium botulinum]
MKARVLSNVELECPRDKNKNLLLEEYVISVDVARSNSDNNNKTAIAILKIKRSKSDGNIRQVQIVNIIEPPNGLNYEEQSVIVKREFFKYGGDLDLNKSRVKAIVIDANIIGQGLVEKLLEDVTDFETNEELPALATINTDDKCKSDAPKVIYALKAQGINGDIIRTFIDYAESNKLKLLKQFDDIKDDLPKDCDSSKIEQACINTQFFIDEVANLKLKKTQTNISVEPMVKRIDKDRYSAIAYGLFYISLFLDNQEDESYDDDDPLVYY